MTLKDFFRRRFGCDFGINEELVIQHLLHGSCHLTVTYIESRKGVARVISTLHFFQIYHAPRYLTRKFDTFCFGKSEITIFRNHATHLTQIVHKCHYNNWSEHFVIFIQLTMENISKFNDLGQNNIEMTNHHSTFFLNNEVVRLETKRSFLWYVLHMSTLSGLLLSRCQGRQGICCKLSF